MSAKAAGRHLTGAVVTLLITAGLLTLVVDDVAGGAFPGSNGRIAIAGTEIYGPQGIWTMAPDGTDLRLVADGGVDWEEGTPSWSPDGARIAFEVRLVQTLYSLGGPSGDSGAAPPPSRAEPASSSPSPLAQSVAEPGIHVVAADGSGPRNLTVDSRTSNTDPSWSPDNRTLAFVGQDTTGLAEIYRLDSENPAVVTQVTKDGIPKKSPAWSPDGQTVAFSEGPAGEANLMLVSAGGGDPTVLTADGLNDDSPTWSPDGSMIAFNRQEPNSGCACRDVYLLELKTRKLVNISARPELPSTDDADPAWSPDGRLIAFSSNRDPDSSCTWCSSIQIFDRASGGIRKLTGVPATTTTSGSSSGFDSREPDWQPVPGRGSLAPGLLDFGARPVGSSSPTQTVTVTSLGPGDLDIRGVDLLGPRLGDFTVARDECSGVSLPPRATCRLELRFSPATTGAASATVVVESNAREGPLRAGLRGVGDPAPNPGSSGPSGLRVEPAELDFGTGPVGGEVPAKAVGVTSTGRAALRIAQASIAGPQAEDFALAVDGCSGTTLAPGGRCELSIRFLRALAGRSGATLLIPTDAPGDPGKVALAGAGEAPSPPPVLNLDPPIGPPGFVTSAVGSGFPPGAEVLLRWARGIGQFRARAGPDGTFRVPVLVFRRDLSGSRALVASGLSGPTFDPTQAEFLVVSSSLQPDSSRRLVLRR